MRSSIRGEMTTLDHSRVVVKVLWNFFHLKQTAVCLWYVKTVQHLFFNFFSGFAVLMSFFPLILGIFYFEVIENVCVGSCAERFVVWLESINTLMLGRISA